MRFTAVAETDVGISKNVNQDSLLIRHAMCKCGEVMMAVVCDGMGGLAKGELASATVIREFSQWFDEELPHELENLDMKVIGTKWSNLLKDLNVKILTYGQQIFQSLGTTFTGILIINDDYLIAHVGDSRAYHMNSAIKQLTEDQTFVAREIKRGTMTAEQAKTDKRRNMLLQCVGASEVVEPEIIYGKCENGVYLLCSDGFRHEITEEEIFTILNPNNLSNKTEMQSRARYLIEENKRRRERDNISVILIKAY